MKTVSVSGSLRENVGKKDAKALRLQGLVPCVIYGECEQKHFFVDKKEIDPLFRTPEVFFVELDLNGTKVLSVIQESQFHKVSGELLHVDFFALSDKHLITMSIPLRVEGSAPGVLKGGKLFKGMRKLRVCALPKDMPEELVVDISKMDIGDEVIVRDLENKNYHLQEVASSTVVMIKTTRNVVEETPAAAVAAKK